MTGIDAFEHSLGHRSRNRQLLARAALNAMGFTSEFSFDISEIRQLSDSSRALLHAFLVWNAAHPCTAPTPDAFPRLVSIAREAF